MARRWITTSPTAARRGSWITLATEVLIVSVDEDGDVRRKSLFLVFFNYEEQTAPREPGGLSWKRQCDADKMGARWPEMLQTNYCWCSYGDEAKRVESPGHMRIYQHSWDPYSSSPVIHLALSSPDPSCFASVWPIVAESNCRQKTTSNDYFICKSESWRAAASEKSQTGTFNKRTRPFFVPDTQFQTTKNIIDSAEIRTPKQMTKRGERTKCTKKRKDHSNNLVPGPRAFPFCCYWLKVCRRLRQPLRINNSDTMQRLRLM